MGSEALRIFIIVVAPAKMGRPPTRLIIIFFSLFFILRNPPKPTCFVKPRSLITLRRGQLVVT